LPFTGLVVGKVRDRVVARMAGQLCFQDQNFVAWFVIGVGGAANEARRPM